MWESIDPNFLIPTIVALILMGCGSVCALCVLAGARADKRSYFFEDVQNE